MQSHRGLTGTGTTLDHAHARQLRADDCILLGLNGRHNIAHAAGTLLIQRGQQRALAVQGIRVLQHGLVEDLVLNICDGAALQHQVTTATHAHRLKRGGLVEGTRLGGTPVHEKATLVIVGNADAADVAHSIRTLAVHVQAAEGQARIHGVQLSQAILVIGCEGITLRTVLVPAHRLVLAHIRQLLTGLFA